MDDSRRLCIHQITLLEQCDFLQSIQCLARHGVSETAVWREKLDAHGTAGECARILEDHGVHAISLCAGGFLVHHDRTEFDRALDENRRWLEQAATIGADSMVVITGGFAAGSSDLAAARARARDGLAALVDDARAIGVRIALEPLHPMVCGFRSVISTLGEANDWLDSIGADDVLGIALDTYALWWDPALAREIARAGSRIINFHVSDWLPETRDVRVDRGMPGDGVIDNRGIRRMVEDAGYAGSVEVEILSARDWWRRDPDEVVRIVKERFVTHL